MLFQTVSCGELIWRVSYLYTQTGVVSDKYTQSFYPLILVVVPGRLKRAIFHYTSPQTASFYKIVSRGRFMSRT